MGLFLLGQGSSPPFQHTNKNPPVLQRLLLAGTSFRGQEVIIPPGLFDVYQNNKERVLLSAGYPGI